MLHLVFVRSYGMLKAKKLPMLKSKNKIIASIVCTVLAFIPLAASAAGLVPCGGDGEHPCSVEDMFTLAAKLISFLLAMSGVYAVFWMVVSAVNMTLSAGNGEAYGKAKTGMTNAIIGFIIVLLAFAIVNTLVNNVFQAHVNLTNPRCYVNPSGPGC